MLQDNVVLIDITSTRGIGRCLLKRQGKTWPKSITLVIRIGELEGFTVSNEKLRLQNRPENASS